MKKIKILLLAAIMTLSICATAFATETDSNNTQNDISTMRVTDPQPWE